MIEKALTDCDIERGGATASMGAIGPTMALTGGAALALNAACQVNGCAPAVMPVLARMAASSCSGVGAACCGATRMAGRIGGLSA